MKQYIKILEKEKKILNKRMNFFHKRINSFSAKTNWHKVLFISIIVLIFFCFIGFWRYSLISAKAFIKIFPKTVEGNFKNIDKLLTLDNHESSDINSFSQSNSMYPADFMKENIYSFEINLKPEDLTIVMPTDETTSTTTSSTTSTTLGSTEILPTIETTTTTVEPTTTTLPNETTSKEESTTTTIETTTTTTLPIETTTTTIQTSNIKIIKPILGFLNNNFKNISLLGNISEIASDVVATIEEKQKEPIYSEAILSGFVLPELLEDEVLTQFYDNKESSDILNVKLGISLASQHQNSDTKATLDVEVFLKDKWERVEQIQLSQNVSNAKLGSFFYINLYDIKSVEDIESLKVRLFYTNTSSDEKDRIYIDSSWIEVAINSDLEAIINDNVSEVENPILLIFEDFHEFDKEIQITIPKEQTKLQKIYKTNTVIEDNIVEIRSKTIILEPIAESGGTTSEALSAEGEATPEDGVTVTEIESTGSSVETSESTNSTSETTTESPDAPSGISAESGTISSEPSSEGGESSSSSGQGESSPSESGSDTSSPASSEGPTSWINKTFLSLQRFSKKLIASVLALSEEASSSEETTTEPTTTTTQTETTTTLVDTIAEQTTTTLAPENDVEGEKKEETTTTTLQENYQTSEDNSLVIREDIVAMENFKIRSAILSTPDRRKFRNNISIAENENEYIVTVKHGPDLIPGKYSLIIKHQDKDGFYRHTINFIWGGEIIKEVKITDSIKSFFTKDNEENQVIYLQIKLEENLYYNLKVQDIVIPLDTPIGFIENNFVFIDENMNLQGLDILSNSFFSQVLEYDRDNYFNINNKKYLIKIENGMILFIKENN